MNFDISLFSFFLATYKGIWDLSYPPGMKPGPLQWKHWVLTSGPPEMSPGNFYISTVGLLVFLPYSLISNQRVVSETFCAPQCLISAWYWLSSPPYLSVEWINGLIYNEYMNSNKSYNQEQAKAPPCFLYPHPYRRNQPSSMKSIQQRLIEPWGSVTEPWHFTILEDYLRSKDPGHKFLCL